MFYNLLKKIFTIFALVSTVKSELSLWPYPSEITTDYTCVKIDSGFSFISNIKSTILDEAMYRYKKISMLDYRIIQPCQSFSCSVLSKINIVVESSDETLNNQTNETYSISITNTRASITSLNIYGAIRGLETFSQLIFKQSAFTYYIPIVAIKDYPRFNFRAILIDTARVFRPIQILKQMLDAMELSKFNLLVLHLTDDQAWTIEIKSYPDLTIKCLHGTDIFHPRGGKRFYTQSEMKDLVIYAKNRGISIVPEIDNPGHIDILKRCYPNLLALANCPAPGTDSNCRSNITKNFRSTPDISNPEWWLFYRTVVKELNVIFNSSYFSIGGDEFWDVPWKYSPSVQQFLIQNKITNAIEWYAKKVQDIVRNENEKIPLMWLPGITILNNTIGMNWYGWVGNLAGIGDWRSAFSRITEKNKNAILAGRWYLGMEPNPLNKSLPRIHPDWKVWYKTDPQDFQGTLDQKKLILGGMGTIWSDLVKLDIFNRSWPLMNAVGEQLWSSREITSGNMTVFTIKRYNDHSIRLNIRSKT